jgi:2-succinyl-5-enolpyruvyl-6-hydroxy-3-cyclohexene-1-carboxylate synthase
MNPSTALATVLVDELIRGGVRDAVLCPGSRSAPFAFALVAAESAGRLRLHVRVDERTAGFLALGLAKRGTPAVVVTTSGTAVANLHPAVLEAAHGNVPLIVVSADRPADLRGSGANQTTDQVGIYGSAPRFFHDVAGPEARPGQVAYWRATTCRALAAAQGAGAAPGPVHLNVALREPLVPDTDDTWVEPLDGRADGRPWTDNATSPATSLPLETDIAKTLVLVGDLPIGDWGKRAAELAARHGWPLVAEPSSGGAWSCSLPHGALLLSDETWAAAHRPDRVLAIGHLTLGRAVSRLLADPSVTLDLISDGPTWPDPAHRARSVRPLTALLDAGAATTTADSTWTAEWRTASERVAAAVGPALDKDWPTGTGVARDVVAALPADAVLFVGASNPVRDVQLAATPTTATVVANRGLSGIDGSLSTATGLALTTSAPSYALVGDLTFLHDAAALVRGLGEREPDLTVVVVNDDGGGIFGLLEPGAPEHVGVFDRDFGTPHGVDLAALCAATKTRHDLATDAAGLRAVVAERPQGVRVVEVRVDRAGHVDAPGRLRDAASRARAG